MSSIDPTYQPRPWRCEKCGTLLGYVLRDVNRVRRLWVLRVQKVLDLSYQPTDAEIIACVEIDCQGRAGPRSMWRVRGLAGNGTVGCEACGSLQEWYPNEDELVDLIRRIRGEGGVKKYRRLTRQECIE